MNRTHADVAAGVLVASILFVGVATAVQFLLTDPRMPSEMGSGFLMPVVGPVVMSLVFATIVGGVYVYVRGQLFPDAGDEADGAERAPDAGSPTPDEAESAANAGSRDVRQVLDVLREDERAVLEPVVESPGLTQIAVRDRSEFSKSKVSQTITDLEDRGLLYRERQGRTYRVYPADDLDERL